MELLEAEKNSEANLLKEKINSLEELKNNVEDSLKTERATSAEQLKSLVTAFMFNIEDELFLYFSNRFEKSIL